MRKARRRALVKRGPQPNAMALGVGLRRLYGLSNLKHVTFQASMNDYEESVVKRITTILQFSWR
jgi:hypothetical protein